MIYVLELIGCLIVLFICLKLLKFVGVMFFQSVWGLFTVACFFLEFGAFLLLASDIGDIILSATENMDFEKNGWYFLAVIAGPKKIAIAIASVVLRNLITRLIGFPLVTFILLYNNAFIAKSIPYCFENDAPTLVYYVGGIILGTVLLFIGDKAYHDITSRNSTPYLSHITNGKLNYVSPRVLLHSYINRKKIEASNEKYRKKVVAEIEKEQKEDAKSPDNLSDLFK